MKGAYKRVRQITEIRALSNKGSSIYDVHTEGDQAIVDTCGLGEGSQAPCGRQHRKLKL